MSREKVLILTGFFCFSLLYFHFYPLITGIVDETAYLSMAYTFQQGTCFYDQAGIESTPASIMVNGHLISRYPPGNGILLVPFTKINWRWSFCKNYIFMVSGYIIFMIILQHFHLPLYYALLFLFHPALVLYSRTIMSDIPATILCLAALLFFIKKRIFFSGLISGVSIAIRYPAAIIPFTLGLIFLYKREFRDFFRFAIGFFIGIIPLLFYHLYSFKSIAGPINENMIGISVTNLPFMLGQFFVSLNILYPLLLIIPFLARLKDKYLFIAPGILFLLFFSLQYYIDTGQNFYETVIRGQRYMLPIIPFLLIPYIEVLNRIKYFKKPLPIFFVALIILSALIHYKHQLFLKQQLDYQNKLYRYTENADLVICNKDIYELINPFLKPVYWVTFESEGKLIPINISNDNKQFYFACLARKEEVKNLFLKLLEILPTKKEIYHENTPYYFSIWTFE